MKKPVLANSGNQERNTPKELVEMARRVLGRIDLDQPGRRRRGFFGGGSCVK